MSAGWRVPLHRLLYRSEVDIRGTEADVQVAVAGIVEASRHANARVGLTGALVYVHGTFVQAMEGPLAAMEATFERICCDLRHREVELLEFMPAAERAFAEWSMARITPELGFLRMLPARNADDAPPDTPSTQAVIRLMRSMLIA